MSVVLSKMNQSVTGNTYELKHHIIISMRGGGDRTIDLAEVIRVGLGGSGSE